MPTGLTDRQAVELLFPIYAMALVIQDGVEPERKGDADFLRFMELLSLAEDEVIQRHGKQGAREKLLRRVMKAAGHAVKPYVKADAEVGKIGLIVFFMLQKLVDAEYLVYSAGSAIDEAVTMYVEAIAHHAEPEKKRASAERQAGKMLVELQREGYFTGAKAREAA